MNPATPAQLGLIRAHGKVAFSGVELESDLLKMARKMKFPVASLDELTTKQASAVLARLAILNDPARRYPRSWMPR